MDKCQWMAKFREKCEYMNVVLDTADQQRGRVDIVFEDRCVVGIEFGARVGVFQPGFLAGLDRLRVPLRATAFQILHSLQRK